MENGSPTVGSPQKRTPPSPTTPSKKRRLEFQSPSAREAAANALGIPFRSPKKAKNTHWKDLPRWKDSNSFFLNMPVEILDKIVSRDSKLELQDHLALSGTCKQFRAAYTDEVWRVLYLQSQWGGGALFCFSAERKISTSLVDRIFSSAWVAAHSGGAEQRQSPSSDYKDRVIDYVNNTTIVNSRARDEFKVSEAEILTLSYALKDNPHHSKAPPMKIFRKAAVYSLAMRVHGGPLGHEAHIRKLADKAAKVKATKEKNGTSPKKTKKSARSSITYVPPPYVLPDFQFPPEDDDTDYI